jgi:hypothetical protein
LPKKQRCQDKEAAAEKKRLLFSPVPILQAQTRNLKSAIVRPVFTNTTKSVLIMPITAVAVATRREGGRFVPSQQQ